MKKKRKEKNSAKLMDKLQEDNSYQNNNERGKN